jgi:hypothetical protein
VLSERATNNKNMRIHATHLDQKESQANSSWIVRKLQNSEFLRQKTRRVVWEKLGTGYL